MLRPIHYFAALFVLFGTVIAQTALAAPSRAHDGALCDRAIAIAAAERGVPERLLRSLALVESGRTLDGARTAWPWTVNMEGKGRWFDSRAAALDYVRSEQARGARSFDVGCLQLNHRWHGEGFASLEQMIDPLANARYAARFLAKLHAETKDWAIAAGYYHSRTRQHAERYRGLVKTAYLSLREKALLEADEPAAVRTERPRLAPAPVERVTTSARAARHAPAAPPQPAAKPSPWSHLAQEFPLQTLQRQREQAPQAGLLRSINANKPGLLRSAKPLF
ncbi:MAG: lytic transglycosylase domain-containing protein [Neomegalonema sp.]|nr:lytic transglycosylase domain-containing protein [Neomegalonema sp.]